jgi:hypothetical protein
VTEAPIANAPSQFASEVGEESP